MNKQTYYTLNTLFKSGEIYWIKSLPTLKKWVLKDLNGNNYLKTIIQKDKNVPRYYFLKTNVKDYIRHFQEGNV